MIQDREPGRGPFVARWRDHLESQGAETSGSAYSLAEASLGDLSISLDDAATSCAGARDLLCEQVWDDLSRPDGYLVVVRDLRP